MECKWQQKALPSVHLVLSCHYKAFQPLVKKLMKKTSSRRSTRVCKVGSGRGFGREEGGRERGPKGSIYNGDQNGHNSIEMVKMVTINQNLSKWFIVSLFQCYSNIGFVSPSPLTPVSKIVPILMIVAGRNRL